MSTHRDTAAFILERLGPGFTTRAMFGEFALYCGDKVVALVCDDQLFVRDVPASAVLAETCEKGSPYPGAKLHYAVPEDRLGDIATVLRAVATQVPAPKPRKKK
jgi:TfoX/Sxy family transcriptional regulator of competence genes